MDLEDSYTWLYQRSLFNSTFALGGHIERLTANSTGACLPSFGVFPRCLTSASDSSKKVNSFYECASFDRMSSRQRKAQCCLWQRNVASISLACSERPIEAHPAFCRLKMLVHGRMGSTPWLAFRDRVTSIHEIAGLDVHTSAKLMSRSPEANRRQTRGMRLRSSVGWHWLFKY